MHFLVGVSVKPWVYSNTTRCCFSIIRVLKASIYLICYGVPEMFFRGAIKSLRKLHFRKRQKCQLPIFLASNVTKFWHWFFQLKVWNRHSWNMGLWCNTACYDQATHENPNKTDLNKLWSWFIEPEVIRIGILSLTGERDFFVNII